jgi:hypothetical protein
MTQFGDGELSHAPRPPDGRAQPDAARGPVPGSVQNAVRLMFLRSAISVVALVVLVAKRDEYEKQYLTKTPTASNATIDAALTVGAVIGIVILVFYVFLAFKVRAGANWARIVTWVIAGLGILGALVSFGQPDLTISRVLGVIVAVIDVAVVVLLALGGSNRFFRRGWAAVCIEGRGTD